MWLVPVVLGMPLEIFYRPMWPFRAVLLLWIFCHFFLSSVCYAFVRVCLCVPCGHLLGKGWLLGFRLWCITVSLSLSPLVSWVRCGSWLYRFLIFARLLTLTCALIEDSDRTVDQSSMGALWLVKGPTFLLVETKTLIRLCWCAEFTLYAHANL